jgi:hypothetical protein
MTAIENAGNLDKAKETRNLARSLGMVSSNR